MADVQQSYAAALELLTGRWRSQILHAGVKLGLLDALSDGDKTAERVAGELSLDRTNTYRLMRALASVGAIEEIEVGTFRLASLGEWFCTERTGSLRGVCLWEEGELLTKVWTLLPDIVRDGGPDAFRRKFDQPIFEFLSPGKEETALFVEAMTSYSKSETAMVLDALAEIDLGDVREIVDLGGGQGHLLCHLLQVHPHLQGTIVELAATLARSDDRWAPQLGVEDRCRYIEGDIFSEVPAANAYLTKHILHDWNDDECRQILETAQRASRKGGRFFIVEYVVPGPDQPDFAKLFDIHMMVVLTGRERTEAEYIELLETAGWTHAKTWNQPAGSLAVIEGRKN